MTVRRGRSFESSTATPTLRTSPRSTRRGGLSTRGRSSERTEHPWVASSCSKRQAWPLPRLSPPRTRTSFVAYSSATKCARPASSSPAAGLTSKPVLREPLLEQCNPVVAPELLAAHDEERDSEHMVRVALGKRRLEGCGALAGQVARVGLCRMTEFGDQPRDLFRPIDLQPPLEEAPIDLLGVGTKKSFALRKKAADEGGCGIIDLPRTHDLESTALVGKAAGIGVGVLRLPVRVDAALARPLEAEEIGNPMQGDVKAFGQIPGELAREVREGALVIEVELERLRHDPRLCDSRFGRLGQPNAELLELATRAAQRELDLFRPHVVAVDRIVDIDADPSVQVLCGVAHGVPTLRSPELRHGDGVLGGKSLGEAPDRLLRGEPHRLHIDVGVRRALTDCLERRD